MVLKNCYLLVVMMAANIFVVNEVRAMEENKQSSNPQVDIHTPNLQNNPYIFYLKNGLRPPIDMRKMTVEERMEATKKIEEALNENSFSHIQKEYRSNNRRNRNAFTFVMYFRGVINFCCTLTLSLANNYFKWWDYNKGKYWKLGCLGWRSGRFLKGYFQFDININLGRGAFYTSLFGLGKLIYKYKCCNLTFLNAFLSIQIIIHLAAIFSISISLDSIIYQAIDILYGWHIIKKKREKITKELEEFEKKQNGY